MLYQTIMADPPWPYGDAGGPMGNGGRGKPPEGVTLKQVGVKHNYATMTIDALKALPIPVADEAHLYLWTTNSFMVEAHEIARAWGFAPKTILTWVKTKADGSPSMKTGWYFRGATEHIVFATRGRLKVTGPCRPTAYFAPRAPHSVKPDLFYALCEEKSPGPRLEVFARRQRAGWDVFGNEVEGSITL